MTDPMPGGGAASGGEWQEQRLRAVRAHAAANEQRRDREAAQARELIAEFVRAAAERGLKPEPLVARPYNGRGRYRTGRLGWYLTPDRHTAIGADGEYYVLAVRPSARAWLTGVTLEPERPRLIIGEGGRDGESIPLQALLARRLQTPT
jgi:hypothetical protein